MSVCLPDSSDKAHQSWGCSFPKPMEASGWTIDDCLASWVLRESSDITIHHPKFHAAASGGSFHRVAVYMTGLNPRPRLDTSSSKISQRPLHGADRSRLTLNAIGLYPHFCTATEAMPIPFCLTDSLRNDLMTTETSRERGRWRVK